LRLVGETRAPGVIFLSGDRHIAEVSVIEDPRIGYPVYDVTSSGLTHTSPRRTEANRHRTGPLVFDLNYGLVVADWQAQVVRLQVRGEDGLLIERAVPFADLR
jgi:alkaline phosphatase D